MRILRIHIKNLNSLKLQSTIDFEQPPLSHADIFAITGNTGSGKTTILDAITLALYGKVARDKDAHKEVLSYGTTECLAEVEFLAEDERYLARWGMHRARGKVDGNLLAPQRELAKWSEKEQSFLAIAEKVRDVDEAIKEITKLDFERFTRSVLLSQGDFAAFLKASDKERSDLLERITGTAIYSELSTAAFERYRQEEQQLKNLQEQQAQLGLLEGESVAPEMLEAARVEVKSQAQIVEHLQKLVQQFDRWVEAKQRIVTLEEEQAQLAIREKEFEPAGERLSKSLALQAQRASFQSLAFHQSKVEAQTTFLETLQKKEKEQQLRLEELARATQTASEQLKAQKATRKEKELLFRQADRLDAQIVEAQKQRIQAEAQEQAAQLEEGKLGAELATLTAEAKQLAIEQKEVQDWLVIHQKFSVLATQLPLIERERDELREVYRQLDKYQQQAKSLTAEQEKQATNTSTLEQAYEGLEREQKTLEEAFHNLLPADFSVDEQGGVHRLSIAIGELQEKKQVLLQLRTLDEAYQQLLKEQEAYEERLANLIARQQYNNKELLNLVEQRDQLQSTLNYRRNIYQQQQLIANYDKDRLHLKPGEPCPLCLSEDHPFHEHPVEPFVDRAKQDLDQAQGQYDDLLKEERKILREETELSQEIEILHGNDLQPVNGRINAQRNKLLEYEEQIAGLLHAPGSQAPEAQRGQLLQQQIGQIDTQLETWRNVQHKLEQIGQQLIKSTAKLQDTERNYLAAKANLKTLNVQLQRAEQDFLEADKQFNISREQLETRLLPLGYKFDLATAKTTFKELSKLTSDFQVHEKRERALAEFLKVNATRLEANKTALDKQGKVLENSEKVTLAIQDQEQQLQANRAELLGDTIVEIARQAEEKAVADAETKQQQLQASEQETREKLAATRQSLADTQAQQSAERTSIAELEKEIGNAVKKLGYSDLQPAASNLLELEEERALQTEQQQLKQRLAETQRATQEARKEEEKHRPENTDITFREQWQAQLDDAKAAQEQALLTLGQLEQQQQQQLAREAQFKTLLEKIELQRQEFNRWARLNEVIGQKDGKKFRSFAQGLTLQRLVLLANQHLEKLNGRYLISKKPVADLELEIIDTFQADNRRSMYTLSGGESFLISLALALGLSDLAGRHAQIQSLFIDEGFGTLDEHSLDLAISTLENLQSSGKTIGIISHVKALKERIGVQIQLHKQSNGFSDLQIRS